VDLKTVGTATLTSGKLPVVPPLQNRISADTDHSCAESYAPQVQHARDPRLLIASCALSQLLVRDRL
jgi:hypothetical protein